MDAIDKLINYNRTTCLLQSVAGRNAWGSGDNDAV